MAYTKTVYEGGCGELVEKKSRFIATIRPVTTEQEAMAFIAEMKKKYYDARHNCSAFIIGRNEEVKRFSDDGEPSGTAGRPILDVLEREGIYNVAVVVTRYFGGTLLGTGGLVRAYQGATQEALKECTLLTQQLGKIATCEMSYTMLVKIQYYCGKEQIPVLDTQYLDNIVMKLMLESDKVEEHCKAIIRMSEGVVEPELSEEMEYALVEGKVHFL